MYTRIYNSFVVSQTIDFYGVVFCYIMFGNNSSFSFKIGFCIRVRQLVIVAFQFLRIGTINSNSVRKPTLPLQL